MCSDTTKCDGLGVRWGGRVGRVGGCTCTALACAAADGLWRGSGWRVGRRRRRCVWGGPSQCRPTCGGMIERPMPRKRRLVVPRVPSMGPSLTFAERPQHACPQFPRHSRPLARPTPAMGLSTRAANPSALAPTQHSPQWPAPRRCAAPPPSAALLVRLQQLAGPPSVAGLQLVAPLTARPLPRLPACRPALPDDQL